MRLSSAVGLSLCVLVASCRSREDGDLAEGTLCRGFELQVFLPKGTPDRLAAGGVNDGVFEQVNDFQRHAGKGRLDWPTIPLYVRWRGHRQGPGSFGHLGQYRYAFLVHDIISLQVAPESACGRAILVDSLSAVT